jgi:hypothetical protein
MKYIPPAYRVRAFNCPHCQAFAQQDWYVAAALHKKSENVPVLSLLHTNAAYITGMMGVPRTFCAKPVAHPFRNRRLWLVGILCHLARKFETCTQDNRRRTALLFASVFHPGWQ